MYYFGASTEFAPIGPGGGVQGFRMRIGRATSLDNGRSWERIGMALDYDEQEVGYSIEVQCTISS
jgi:hypothetical protein